jgi:exopolyphosphatase / guanosine-5'-triphosphate,3'-diphosphate pyrophosphatase
LIYAEPAHALQMMSLQIGSVRLTERIIAHDPPSHEEMDELNQVIDRNLNSIPWTAHPDVMVGIAGTVTTICAVAMEMATYDSARVHGHVLSRDEVARVSQMFARRTIEERKMITGLLPERADVIFAGSTILLRIMDRFGLGETIVSDQGVRWGLIWRELNPSRAK